MYVSVIPHQETGGSASGNWLPAALARVAAAAGFAPGINKPHLDYKSNAASHLTSSSHPSVSQLSFLNFGRPTSLDLSLPRPPPPFALPPFESRFAPRPILFPLAPFPDFRQPACFRPPRSPYTFRLVPLWPYPRCCRPLLNPTLTTARLLQPAWQVSNSSSDFLARRECLPLTTATLVQLKTRSRQLPVKFTALQCSSSGSPRSNQ